MRLQTMYKRDAFNLIPYEHICDMMLPDAIVEKKLAIVEQFFSWNHKLGQKKVEKGVLNIILILTIYHTNGDFNDVYLRRVLETFIQYKIHSTNQALEYFENILEDAVNNDSKYTKPGISGEEPEWVQETIDSLWENV